MTSVLVVDDSAVDRCLVGGLLEKRFPNMVQYAADGLEAIARMKRGTPGLVVTDLTMPIMDGLELVHWLREHHPETPVILMTAYGNEMLALEALTKGAASYVPKSRLGDRLLDTVDEVLALARADRHHEQLLDCLRKTEFQFSLENEAALINPLVDLVQQMVVGIHLTDFVGRLQIGVALKEAMLNALFHGSLEITQEQMAAVDDRLLNEEDVSLVEQRRSEPPYRDRRIDVRILMTPDEARFVVRDQGPGFDVTTIPNLVGRGPMELEHGRGLSLMKTFMDEVVFNEKGNEVTMVKRRDSAKT